VTLADRVSDVLAGRRLSAVVVGYPLQLSGKEGLAVALAREIGSLLAEGLGCPAVYLDERLTTKDALARRHEAGITGAKARRDLDAWAAAAILQSFLDRRHGGGER
jgi:putative Holliday junction resolvase